MMPVLILFYSFVLLATTGVLAQETPRIQPSVRQAPTEPIDLAPIVQLNEDIRTAEPGEVFNVEMRFDNAASLGDLQKIVDEFQVLRLIATVSFSSPTGGESRSRITLGSVLSEFDPWNRGVCRVKIQAVSMGNTAFLDIPADTWPTYEISVLGPAAAIRNLLSGDRVPGGIILDGRKQNPRHLDVFGSAIQRQNSEPIQAPDNVHVPENCQQFTARIPAPILTGTRPLQSAEYGEDYKADFRERIRALLAERNAETPVTIQIVLDSVVGVEAFAQLVERYEIDGLMAEFSPVATDRIISGAALSIFGSSLVDQVGKFNCNTSVGESAKYAGTWVSRRARVSLPNRKAWRLIDDASLIEARLLYEFPLGALDVVSQFHQNAASELLVAPANAQWPPGCDRFVQQ